MLSVYPLGIKHAILCMAVLKGGEGAGGAPTSCMICLVAWGVQGDGGTGDQLDLPAALVTPEGVCLGG